MSLTENHQSAQEEMERRQQQEAANKKLDEAWHEFAEDYSEEIIHAIQNGRMTPSLQERWKWYKIHALSK